MHVSCPMAVEKVRLEIKMVAESAKLETKMADQKGELDKQFKMAQKNCDLIRRMWCK